MQKLFIAQGVLSSGFALARLMSGRLSAPLEYFVDLDN